MESPTSDQENMSPQKIGSLKRRRTLKNLLWEMREIGESESVDKDTMQNVGSKLRKINELDDEIELKDRVQFYEEIFLDFDILGSASDYLKKATYSLDVSKTYDPMEFAQNIRATLAIENKEDLLQLSRIAKDVQLYTQINPYAYTYGAFKFNQTHVIKQRKERVKVNQVFTKKAPEAVVSSTAEEQNIEQIVTGLFNILKDEYNKNNEHPIGYYDYVIDTSDFGATIENVFHFSFLIRNGRAQLDLDGKGVPFIKPIHKSAVKEYRSNAGTNAQVITTINYEEWKKFKKPGFLQKHKQKN